MTYNEILNILKTGSPTNLARRKCWSGGSDKIAYVIRSGELEKRENNQWIPYLPSEADGTATDWELVSTYS